MTNISDEAYEIYLYAATYTSDYDCKSLEELMSHLNILWPEKEAKIEEALNFWANVNRQSNPKSIPSFLKKPKAKDLRTLEAKAFR